VPPSFVVPPLDRPVPLRVLARTALRRPGARRLLSALAAVLVLSGLGVAAYPVGTDAYGAARQRELQADFAAPPLRKAYLRRDVRVGDGLTRLRIAAIGLEVVVVEGVGVDALRAGAGHYPGTPLPGEPGNVAIAGHRVTYGQPFHRLDEVRPGDLVELETPFAVHRYRVPDRVGDHGNPWVVAPDEIDVVGPAPGRVLTLTTCHPKGSARQRLVLRAELVESRRHYVPHHAADPAGREGRRGP
jgi:sortase A